MHGQKNIKIWNFVQNLWHSQMLEFSASVYFAQGVSLATGFAKLCFLPTLCHILSKYSEISTVCIYFVISAVYCNTNVQLSGTDSHESQCALPSGTHLPFLLSTQPSVQAKHTALLHVAHPMGHLRHSRRFLSAKYPSGQTLEHVPDRAYRPGRHVMHCVSLEPLHVSHDE